MSILFRVLIISLFAISLSGCIAAAAGAGVAGGVYFERHYKVEKKETTKKNSVHKQSYNES